MNMRSSLIVVSVLLILSSCTLPGSSSVSPKPIEYPTTQSGSPAAQYCTKNGGQVTYEKNPSVPTMDMIYCNLPSWQKVDAWQYMGEWTNSSGAIVPVPAT